MARTVAIGIQDYAKIIENNQFYVDNKVREADEEISLQDTVNAALQQIEEKSYEQMLTAKGIENDHIRKYGFAFEGKKVLIG